MESINQHTPLDRITYQGPLEPLIEQICLTYQVGAPVGFKVISVGYEDCNIIIETANQKYVAKIFSRERTPEIIHRYEEIMTRVLDANIHHPKLYQTTSGKYVSTNSQAKNISLVLMDFVPGATYLELNTVPTEEEQKQILADAARIHRIDFQPSFLYDAWAIPHLATMYAETKPFIQSADRILIEKVIKRYQEIPIDQLPRCLVHGDFTKANILKGNDGIVYILDFSVTNWTPRIQELAIIAENLLFDARGDHSLKENTIRVADAYHRFNPLTQLEHDSLYSYALAGATMEFMGAHQQKYLKGNDTEETAYWLELGRKTLQQELTEKHVI